MIQTVIQSHGDLCTTKSNIYDLSYTESKREQEANDRVPKTVGENYVGRVDCLGLVASLHGIGGHTLPGRWLQNDRRGDSSIG